MIKRTVPVMIKRTRVMMATKSVILVRILVRGTGKAKFLALVRMILISSRSHTSIYTLILFLPTMSYTLTLLLDRVRLLLDRVRLLLVRALTQTTLKNCPRKEWLTTRIHTLTLRFTCLNFQWAMNMTTVIVAPLRVSMVVKVLCSRIRNITG